MTFLNIFKMAAGIVEKVSEKVSFATKVPMLLKATSDNDTPTPGYLYQEIIKITMDSYSNCHLLLDFLNERLKKSSPHVKYKTLKIMTYLSANGQLEFRSALRHKNQQIRDASNFSGTMDALQGDTLNQKVRKAAAELNELLFNIENPESSQQSFIMAGPSGQKMEGFGNTPTVPSSKSGSFLDTVKGLSGRISSFGSNSKTDSTEDFITNYMGVDDSQSVSFGEVSSAVSTSAPSKVQFINYSERTWCPDKEGFQQKASHSEEKSSISSYDDGDDDDDECDDKDDYVTIESQLVKKLTEEGGIRAVPSRESLEQFTQRCSTLDLVKILKLINTRIEDPSLDVQMKCLFALEHLLRSTIPNIASKVLEYVNLQELMDSQNNQIKSKANKVMYIAKSKRGSSEGVKRKEEEIPESSLPANVQLLTQEHKLDSNVDLLKSAYLDYSSHGQHTSDDIFHGLQIHERQQDIQAKSREEANQSIDIVQSRGESNQLLVDSDLMKLDLMGISRDKKTVKNDSSDCGKSLESFDPLDMGLTCGKRREQGKESNAVDDILWLDDLDLNTCKTSSTLFQTTQPLSSSSLLPLSLSSPVQPIPSSSSLSSSPLSSPTHQLAVNGQSKNSGFKSLSDLSNNWNNQNLDLKTHDQELKPTPVISSDDPFILAGNSASVTGLLSKTGKSSLSGQPGSSGQPSGQCYVGQSGFAGQSGFSGQSDFTGQPGFTGQSGFTSLTGQSSLTGQHGFTGQSSGFCGNAVSTSNPGIIPQKGFNSTLPLKLSKPSNQKTDFDFLSKSKRESAFSFVQDEMKANKK